MWQPWDWTDDYLTASWGQIFGSDAFLQDAYVRTFIYVAIAASICLVVGYAGAYYVARFAGRWRTLILILLVSPFWISYLMRMLAWINLLDDEGYVNKLITGLHLVPQPINWLEGNRVTVVLGLVYGYIPVHDPPLVRVPGPDRRPPAGGRPRPGSRSPAHVPAHHAPVVQASHPRGAS